MNVLVKKFLEEIINEHSNINRISDDYELEITSDNVELIKEMIELFDNEERKKEDLKRLRNSNIGDKFYMFGYDRNNYLYNKLFGK